MGNAIFLHAGSVHIPGEPEYAECRFWRVAQARLSGATRHAAETIPQGDPVLRGWCANGNPEGMEAMPDEVNGPPALPGATPAS